MSDNRTSDKATPRLSIRIPRSFKNIKSISSCELIMSPKTTTISHPSSSFKEVPRAALLHSENSIPSGISDLIEMSSTESFKYSSEDPTFGLQALAASAAASLPETTTDRVSSPPESPQFDEVEYLGKLFNFQLKETEISRIYNENCSETYSESAKKKLYEIIERADNLLSSNGIAMSLKNILPVFIQKLVEQETSRTGKKDLTGLLMNESFLSASATVILLIPRLVSCIISVEQVSVALNSNLFDVLLAIENLLKTMPDLMKLEEIQIRMKQLQQNLLESLVWKSRNNSENSVLYELLKSELKQFEDCPETISKVLSGVRSAQRALETLSGNFPSSSRVTRLEIFFRKYLRLSSQRLQFATLKLGLSNSVTQLAWEFFFDLIQSEGINEIFKNRHLNQILLATIYCCSGLLEEERSLPQICQVLPSSQGNTTWLSKVSIGDSGDSCDFYTFYNEIFLPHLRRRIETFLTRFKGEGKDDKWKWILNELFTTAPFPKNPSHKIASNVIVSLNRLNQFNLRNSSNSITKYEWQCPYPPQDLQCHDDEHEQIRMPQTPSNTSLLLNIPTTSLYSATEKLKQRRPLTDETDEIKEFRMKKVARRLDFSEE
jgi:hypothetical protein